MIESRGIEIGQGQLPADVAGRVGIEAVAQMQRPSAIGSVRRFDPVPDPAGVDAGFGGPAAHGGAGQRTDGPLEIVQQQPRGSRRGERIG